MLWQVISSHSPGQTLTFDCFCHEKECVHVCGHFYSSLTAHPLGLWFQQGQQGQILKLLVLLIQDEILCSDQQETKVCTCLHCLGGLGGREKLVFRLAPEWTITTWKEIKDYLLILMSLNIYCFLIQTECQEVFFFSPWDDSDEHTPEIVIYQTAGLLSK